MFLCDPLCENGRITFELASLGAVVRAADVTLDDELSHVVAVDPQRDLGQYLVKFVELLASILVRNNPPVLS